MGEVAEAQRGLLHAMKIWRRGQRHRDYPCGPRLWHPLFCSMGILRSDSHIRTKCALRRLYNWREKNCQSVRQLNSPRSSKGIIICHQGIGSARRLLEIRVSRLHVMLSIGLCACARARSSKMEVILDAWRCDIEDLEYVRVTRALGARDQAYGISPCSL
jgi:hypothetical protein